MATTFITGSAQKFREVEAVWPGIIRREVDLPEIQSLDPEEIIRHKLEAARQLGVVPCLVEDTSLTIADWNGLPGPLIKWFIASLGVAGLAQLALAGGGPVAAEARTVVGAIDAGGAPRFASGTVSGTIVSPRGEGFGWDAIFEPTGSTKTFGEMSPAEKAIHSMRVRAIEALRRRDV